MSCPKFHVGQKIICISNRPWADYIELLEAHGKAYPEVGQAYNVRETTPSHRLNTNVLLLQEVVNEPHYYDVENRTGECSWGESCFEAVADDIFAQSNS